MANIDKELQAIQDAIYGEEVRESIHDAIKAVNESATDSALVCETKAKEALESAKIALEKALEILSTADASKSYAVGGTGTREGEDTDNAKYYMKMAQSAASGLIPSGNVTFEQLMALTDVAVGAMYHVTTEFTTNEKFEDYASLGAEEYPAGTNVYMKVDGLWCTMVGSEVVGVKGEAEESYRTGHVNITKEDVGIVDATSEKAGIVKLSDSSAVTDSTGLALPATEKNASIEGTLANQLDTLNSNLQWSDWITLNDTVSYKYCSNLMLVKINYTGELSTWENIEVGVIPSNFKIKDDSSSYCGITGSDHHFFRGAFNVRKNNVISITCWQDGINTHTSPFSPVVVPIDII